MKISAVCALCVLLLWAELAAGRPAEPTKDRPVDEHKLRAARKLNETLHITQMAMNEEKLRRPLPFPCSHSLVPLNQNDALRRNLSELCYLHLCHFENLTKLVFKLVEKGNDLLPYLNSTAVPTPTCPPEPPHFDKVTKSVECVSCLIQLVKGVINNLEDSKDRPKTLHNL